MKLCLLLFASSLVFAADWDAVQRIPAAQRIEVTERSGGGRLRATRDRLFIAEINTSTCAHRLGATTERLT